VSTNRTVVDLVTAKLVGRAELADLGLHLVLQCLQSRELVHPPGQPFEIRDDQCAQRAIALRCGDPGVAVHVVGHGDRNILHSFTVTQFMWPISCGPASVMRLLALRGNISGDGTLAVAAVPLRGIPRASAPARRFPTTPQRTHHPRAGRGGTLNIPGPGGTVVQLQPHSSILEPGTPFYLTERVVTPIGVARPRPCRLARLKAASLEMPARSMPEP